MDNRDNEPVEPVRLTQWMHNDGSRLLIGTCPICGQKNLNNEDNNYCGKCGVKLKWREITPLYNRK